MIPFVFRFAIQSARARLPNRAEAVTTVLETGNLKHFFLPKNPDLSGLPFPLIPTHDLGLPVAYPQLT